ncbi:B12-binding domain-containing radical SAM protein [Patescibacteria group bacterium]|nr:B12-binding domain-containing radical SAM protein [Patescibacteria group bacterium]
MNILFIYPEIPDTFWSFKYALKFIHKKAALPPLGLITIAAMLPKEWNKKLVDLNVDKLINEDLQWADYVFISGMIIQRDSAKRIIKLCNEAHIPVVAGGPLFTMEHEEFPLVDHFILGEAEDILQQFVDDISQQRIPKRVYQSTGVPDIKKTPVPMWRLLNLSSYAVMSIQCSRGCPNDCNFCNVTTLFGKRVRIKTAEQIIAELDGLYQAGWRGSVFFADDNFIARKMFLTKKLLPALVKWQKGKNIAFTTQTTVDLADNDELMKLMVDGGVRTVFIGIETPIEASLVSCKKRSNINRDMVLDIKKMQRAGLQVYGGFIVGFDDEPTDVFQKVTNFIQQSGVVVAMIGILQAPPGTALYKERKQQGRILEGKLSGNNFDSTNIIPKISLSDLCEGYASILKGVYSPKPYYLRIRTFLQEYNLPKIQSKVHMTEISAAFRAIILFGFKGKKGEKSRRYFWQLMFWTLFRRPKSIPLALTMVVYGYHFAKVSHI